MKVTGRQVKSNADYRVSHSLDNLTFSIDDWDLRLLELRAIMLYLLIKYAPESPIYPSDPKSRARYFRHEIFSFRK